MVVSVALLAMLVGRLDIEAVTVAIGAASLLGLIVATGLVATEVALRAWRWRMLLQGAADVMACDARRVAYSRTVAYLCIGYLANALLPARLGDLGRAHLTGRDLRIPRSTALGTIAIERIADAGLITAVVVTCAVLTPEVRTYAGPVVTLAAVSVTVGLILLAGILYVRRRAVGRGTFQRIAAHIDAVAAGSGGVRSPVGATIMTVLTAAAFSLAVMQFWFIARAVGLGLSPSEAGIVMGMLALSTAIPAAPGSIGTYEVTGVTVLVAMGADPARALAAVVLVHVIATVPPVAAGVVAALRLGLDVRVLRRSARPGPVAVTS